MIFTFDIIDKDIIKKIESALLDLALHKRGLSRSPLSIHKRIRIRAKGSSESFYPVQIVGFLDDQIQVETDDLHVQYINFNSYDIQISSY